MVRKGLVFVGALVMGGCGVVSVKGLPSVNGGEVLTAGSPSSGTASGTQSATPQPEGIRGDPRKGPAAPNPKLVAMYRSLDYTCCTEGRKRGSEYYEKAGLETIGAFKHGNPDPEWLPGWTHGVGNDDHMDAVVQAAINRTWIAQCHADYAEFRAAERKIEGARRPELEEIEKRTNYYERSRGLVNLMLALLGDVEAAKIDLPEGHPAARVGLGYEIVAGLFDAHRDAKRGFRMKSNLGRAWGQIEAYGQHGRPWSNDEDFERDAFCTHALTSGTQKTPKLPSLGPWDPKAYAMIRWPIPEARQGEIEKKEAEARKATQAALVAPAEFKVTGLDMGFREEEERAPDMLFVGEEFVVEKIAKEGDKTKIVAKRHTAKPLEYGCKKTNRVESIDPSGYVRYAMDCQIGTSERDVIVNLTFADLTDSVTPGQGDELMFYGKIVDRKDKTLKNLPSHIHTQREYTMDAHHLAQVKRGGKVILAY